MNPQGVIVGGWEYVVGAYSLTATVFTLYALSVAWRLRKGRGDEEK